MKAQSNLASEMSDSEVSETYLCLTQKDDEETIAAAPATQLESNADSIVVGDIDGLRMVVPRWDISQSSPTILKWFLDTQRFPSSGEAAFAENAFNQAVKEWNAVAFGVNVEQTLDRREANFNLVYRKNTPNDRGIYARAFMPHEADTDVKVFTYGLDQSRRYRLKNVFLHELGHVFGLRHEFAIHAEGNGAEQFMSRNRKSVMAYNKIPIIQETDKEGIRAFYKLPKGYLIRQSLVTDYPPQLRSTN